MSTNPRNNNRNQERTSYGRNQQNQYRRENADYSNDSDVAEYDTFEDENEYGRSARNEYAPDFEDYRDELENETYPGRRRSFSTSFQNQDEDYDLRSRYREEEPDTYQREEYGSRRGYTYGENEDQGVSDRGQYGSNRGEYGTMGRGYRSSYTPDYVYGRNEERYGRGTGWGTERSERNYGERGTERNYGMGRNESGRNESYRSAANTRRSSAYGGNGWREKDAATLRSRTNGNYGSSRRNGSSKWSNESAGTRGRGRTSSRRGNR